jgi:hypothetical protein
MDIQYKAVKNSKYPGRPPSGCVWVKDGAAIKTNEKGEVAYRKAKPSELKAKKSKAKARTPRKKRAAKKAETSDVRSVFLSKRAYNELTYEELEKVVAIASSKIEASKAAEKVKLEKQIEKLKGKLEGL